MKEIIFNPTTAGSPVVSIAEHAISMNLKAVEMLGKPSHVMVKIWPEEKAVVFIPADPEIPQAIKFASRLRDNMIRIANRTLIRFIGEHVDGFEPAESAIRFKITKTDLETGPALIVHLDEPLTKIEEDEEEEF